MDFKKVVPIIGIIILFYILSTMDLVKIVHIFADINKIYGLLSALAIYPILLIVNLEWQLILKKHNINVSYWYSLKNLFIGYFYGFITPGGVGGYASAFYLRDKSGESIHKCFVNLLIFFTVDYLSLISIGIFGGLLIINIYPNILPILVILFLIEIALLILFIRKNTGQQIYQKIIKSNFLSRYKEKFDNHFEKLYVDIPRIIDLIPASFVSFFGWLLWFSELYFISILFSINVPYHYFIITVAIASVIGSIPITFKGLGTREATLIGLFSFFSIPQENVVAFSLFWFFTSWLIPSLIGSIVTIRESRKNPDLPKNLKIFNKK